MIANKIALVGVKENMIFDDKLMSIKLVDFFKLPLKVNITEN